MISIVSMLVVTTLLGGAIAVIAATLRGNADAIVAALAGRSFRAEAPVLPEPRLRLAVRTPLVRTLPMQPLRAAA
jgi:hypothetical protein